jgi:hypothetical protein
LGNTDWDSFGHAVEFLAFYTFQTFGHEVGSILAADLRAARGSKLAIHKPRLPRLSGA